jgi:hypothetical protein
MYIVNVIVKYLTTTFSELNIFERPLEKRIDFVALHMEYFAI